MDKQKIAFLLAPGAGASSEHPRMQTFARLLEPFGSVHLFDYAYLSKGRKRPDPLHRLIDEHRAAVEALRQKFQIPIVLVGKSMGGRIGCHVALLEHVAAVICLGYPLCGGGDPAKLRDEVLVALSAPALFIQGTRDPLCPLELLAKVQSRMLAPNKLQIVDGGDHSLLVSKAVLKARGMTQEDVDREAFSAIPAFLKPILA